MSENKDSRIKEIEQEIKEIKSAVSRIGEIAGTVEDLKRALIEVRSTISELENPFNLLKLITDEEGLAKANEAKPLLEKMAKENEEKRKVPEISMSEAEEKIEKFPETRAEEHIVKRITEAQSLSALSAVRVDFGKTIALIEWIYTMLDIGFDENGIRRICEYSEFFGFIPKGSASYISDLAGVVKMAKSNDIAEDTFILSIYNIANIMGVKIDQEEVASLIKNFLRSRRFNGVRAKGWASQ